VVTVHMVPCGCAPCSPSPAVALMTPVRQLMVVLLPAPLGPSRHRRVSSPPRTKDPGGKKTGGQGQRKHKLELSAREESEREEV